MSVGLSMTYTCFSLKNPWSHSWFCSLKYFQYVYFLSHSLISGITFNLPMTINVNLVIWLKRCPKGIFYSSIHLLICSFNKYLLFQTPEWKWQPTPIFLPGESHGQRSLVGVQGVAKSQALSAVVQYWANQTENCSLNLFSRVLTNRQPLLGRLPLCMGIGVPDSTFFSLWETLYILTTGPRVSHTG